MLIPDACNGTYRGHSGELCTESPLDIDNFRQQRDLCARCPSGFLTALLLGAMVLAIIVFSYLVWDNLNGAQLMMPTDEGALTKMPFHSIAIRKLQVTCRLSGC